jgi:hypothetical protein
MNGAASAYFGLAYNLYLLEHNIDLQRRLIARLRNPEQFHGAYYETFVAACCIRAGFELQLENEADGSSTHCEFSAKNRLSGNVYSVEAKSRTAKKSHYDVGNQLYAALRKVANYQRIVFIDINVPEDPAMPEESLVQKLTASIKGREATLKISGQAAPSAVIIVTNNPYHHDLEGVGLRLGALGVGFKIDDFDLAARLGRGLNAGDSQARHDDIFWLVESVRSYRVPSTFDGEGMDCGVSG